MKYGIVAIGYNRLDSMKRLLIQLAKCNYDEHVDLIISLDKGDNESLYDFTELFQWKFGEKKVIRHTTRLGLKEHVLSCGDLLNQFDLDAIAVFEDDVFPGEDFFQFMKQAVLFYKDDEHIAGISLYQHGYSASVQLPFTPQPSEYDVYFMKIAQSWGQVWTKHQWNEFKSWYMQNSELWDSSEFVPDNVAKWPKSSWLKYYWRYCGERDKYFVYPYRSLVTCFSEAGEHTLRTSSICQVPMVHSWNRAYHFVKLSSENVVRYDAFWENEAIAEYCAHKYGIDKNEIAVDIYGLNKNKKRKIYWITQEIYNYEIIDSFALELKPHEMNVLYENPGSDIFIYNTEKKADNPFKKQGYADYLEYYLTREFYRKRINKLVRSVYWRSFKDNLKKIRRFKGWKNQ